MIMHTYTDITTGELYYWDEDNLVWKLTSIEELTYLYTISRYEPGGDMFEKCQKEIEKLLK